MAATRIRIDGLSETLEALRELPKATARNVVVRVLKKRGQPIADKARRLAPVESGKLRSSVGVSTKLTRRQRSLHTKAGPQDVEVFVGAGPQPQAHMQEFGTFKDRPQPFMRPAWDDNKGELIDGIAKDLWDEIAKAAARLARKAARAAARGR